jgi:hypothetical protein
MATILNWGSSVGNRTIDTSWFFLIPETEAQRFARTGVALPANLDGKNDFGLGFKFTVEDGVGTFVLDNNGLKISSGLATYSAPPSGVVDLRAIGYPPGVLSSGVYINALDLTTIRLGDENDSFALIGQGITQSVSAEVNKEASQGYIFQSNIFAGAGDDTVVALMPWQSVFKGGTNTSYRDAINDPSGSGIAITLDDSLTLEEVPFGDLIELKGSRFDWDIEFKDGNGDDLVTLESILDERDYIAVSNNNRIFGFERILFGDILFDLVLYGQQESSAVFGQPDYYLNGLEALAPELNSDIASGSELWEAFRFNRTKLQGITGTATDQTDVFTGDANDTPFLVGALRFASLNTEAGNDIVEIGAPGQTAVEDASIDLGSGSDQLKVNGLFTRSSVIGGVGADNIIFSTINNSSVDSGIGNDVVQVTTSASQTRFDGGEGNDVLLLPGTFASYQLNASNEAGVVTFNDAFGNSITGFETIRFSDINLDALQTLSLSGPPTPVNEGANASYIIALSDSGLASGNSVAFSLQLGDGTAQFSADLAALVQGSLQAAAGIVLSNVSVDAATGLIRAVASASRGFSTGSTIATLNLPVAVDLQNEPDEDFTVALTDFVQAQSPVSTTIRNVLPVTIRLNGPASVTEGQAASYALALDGVGLAAGRSVTFSLDSASGTATEGTDFAALLGSSLEKADGITLGAISTAANGAVTVTATNTSGAALAVGATLLTVQLPTTTDALVEGSETFGVTLASSTAVVSSGVVTTTINDLVPTPTIALAGQASVVEGQSAAYAVTLGGSGLLAGQSVTLTLDSATGTATEGVDFAELTAGALTAGSGVTLSGISTDPVTKAVTLTATNSSGASLAAGAQLVSVSVPTTADLFSEGPESFAVSLSSASATVSAGSISTTISDNDPLSVRIAGPASVAEGSTTSAYTIFLGSGVGLGAGASVSFSIDTASGTATEGADFAALVETGLTGAPGITLSGITTAANGTITVTATNRSGADLAAGSALLSFAIGTIPDAIAEANETFSLNLAGGAGVTVEGLASVVTTVSDDDAPALKLTGDAAVAEGAAAAYALALDGVGLGVGRSVDFRLSTLEGTAKEGIDFARLLATNLQPVSGINLSNISTDPSGGISGRATNIGSTQLAVNAELLTFSIAAAADAVAELPETYNVLLQSIDASVSTATFTTTITDPSLPVIRLTGSPAVAEGSPAIYGVSLDGGTALGAGRSVTITLDTAGLSATEGRDFTAIVGESIKSTSVGISLSNISTDPLTQAVTFTAMNTSPLDLAAGSQLLSFELSTTPDLFAEGPETFSVSLASSSATVSAGSITTTISDDDSVAIKLTGSTELAEGASASYAVSLDGVGLGAGRSVSFTLDSANGSATAGLDFQALIANALNASAGITLVTSTAADGSIAVTATNSSGADLVAGAALLNFATPTVADVFIEGNETFALTLTSSSATVSAGLVTTTITDDDAPALKLTGSAAVAEGAAAAYALALDGVGLGAGRSVTFTLDSASGTATEGVDFAALTAAALTAATGISLSGISTAANGTITATATNTSGADLAVGASILSFSLAATADSIAEGSESYSVSLGGANGSGTVSTTISDGDGAVIRLIGSPSVLEGANASYAVSLDGVGLGAGQRVTLTLDSATGTATEGVDFAELTAGALTAGSGVTLSGISTDPVTKAVTLTATNSSGLALTSGSQLVSFSLAAVQDQSTEGDETFRVLLNSEAATVTNTMVATTIRDLVGSGGDGGSGGSGSGGDGGVPGGGGDGGSSGGGGTGEPAPRRQVTGTSGADEITGSSLNNVIYGGKGADLMTGGGGSNKFRFKLSDGLNQGDVITDFRPGLDTIRVEGVSRNSLAAKAFDGNKRLRGGRARSAVQVVDSLDSADRSKAVFVYAQLTGELAYNSNGSGRGFGRDGGVIASLSVLLTFDARDIQLAYGS